MDIQLFDNFDEDGQLSLFAFDEADPDDYEEDLAEEVKSPKGEKAAPAKKQPKTAKAEAAADLHLFSGGNGNRISKCSSCGKLLFIQESAEGYSSHCNNCSIDYFQKK